MEAKKKCSIGIFSREMCSKDDLIDCKSFSDEDRISLNARSGTVVNFICAKHNTRVHYISNQRVCIDPYKIHKVQVIKSLRVVSFELYNLCKVSFPSIVPGTILFITCSIKINSDLKKIRKLIQK